MTIEAVLWDFGGVFTTSPFDAFNRYERERGLPSDIIRRINSVNPDANAWVGDRSRSHDTMVKRSGDDFVRLAMNTYRVLLTRGLKGCYVTFLDKETERFFRSRTANF